MKNLARSRLANIGLPSPKNKEWYYFPVSKLREIDIPEPIESSASDILGIKNETNAAALFPIAFAAYPYNVTVNQKETENGILKTRDEFSHSHFCVLENAKLNLEITGNKTERNFISERIDIELKDNAEAFLFFKEQGTNDSTHLTHFRISVSENAKVYCNMLLLGKGISRTSVEIFLNGKNACADYRSLALLKEQAEAHTHIKIHHNAQETNSSQFARHFLTENSYASYDGSVFAMEDCSKISSSQLVNTILQDNAKISVKPNLKIYHDDVECSHGNTCGSFDAEELFYLESRGIQEVQAKRILTRSFAREIFQTDTPHANRIFEELSLLGF